MKAITTLGFVLALSLLPALAYADASTKPSLNLAAAKKIAAAAAAYARANNAPGSAIAIVDDGGNLLYLERLDGTFPAGANISIGKARTAALFRKPTKFFEDVVNQGRTTMVALPDFTPLQGGVPIVFKGVVIGGIGVSGASSAQQDEDVALAGAKSAETPGK